MKNKFLRISFVATVLLAVVSCNKKEAAPEETSPVATENVSDSAQINQDKEVLSNDSATVKTAVGVKDEEANAKADEAAADKKLESDEKKDK